MGRASGPIMRRKIASLRMRNRHKTLDIESAGSQELDGQGYLETRITKAGGVRYQGHEGSFQFTGRHAEDKSRANFDSQTEVDQPDLASQRGPHDWVSRRSRSSNTSFAAAISSLSLGAS